MGVLRSTCIGCKVTCTGAYGMELVGKMRDSRHCDRTQRSMKSLWSDARVHVILHDIFVPCSQSYQLPPY